MVEVSQSTEASAGASPKGNEAKVSKIDHMAEELERQAEIDKCLRFKKWCEDNGVKMPKLEYPAFFDGGLLGVRIKEDINHNEAFLSVPMKI